MAIVIPYVQCTTLGSMYQCVLSLCLRTFTLAMLEVMLLTSNGSNPKAVITARMGARKLLVYIYYNNEMSRGCNTVHCFESSVWSWPVY
jgi:hypothetical protein